MTVLLYDTPVSALNVSVFCLHNVFVLLMILGPNRNSFSTQG